MIAGTKMTVPESKKELTTWLNGLLRQIEKAIDIDYSFDMQVAHKINGHRSYAIQLDIRLPKDEP